MLAVPPSTTEECDRSLVPVWYPDVYIISAPQTMGYIDYLFFVGFTQNMVTDCSKNRFKSL